MKLIKFNLVLTLIFSVILGMSSAIAETKINLEDKKSFKDLELKAGNIKVLVTYTKQDEPNGENNIFYRIFYGNKQKVKGSVNTYMVGQVFLQDLDNDKNPEVIVSTFSGGAHCCTEFTIYNWQKKKNNFVKIETGFLNGGGGAFNDLDGDGQVEFSTVHNGFLYMFSSYAGSFPPLVIMRLENGKFKDVTRQYPKQLREHLKDMNESFLAAKKEGYEVNGILAGYVAQKILLGEYEEGWKFMLANYDRKSEWGLEIYKNDKVVGKYKDFPTALKAFLIDLNYLDKKGNPRKYSHSN